MRVEVTGLDDVIKAIRELPTSIDTEPALESVAEKFSAILRAATPPGYSGRLKESVLWHADGDEAEVGYDEEVEKAGNPALDSVTRPRTRGRSVLRWVPSSDLESILEETFTAFAAEGVLHLERELADGIS